MNINLSYIFTPSTGKAWEDKVKEVRAEMIKKGGDLMVVTAADEVAWLLNLRGNDAKNTPGKFVLFSIFFS